MFRESLYIQICIPAFSRIFYYAYNIMFRISFELFEVHKIHRIVHKVLVCMTVIWGKCFSWIFYSPWFSFYVRISTYARMYILLVHILFKEVRKRVWILFLMAQHNKKLVEDAVVHFLFFFCFSFLSCHHKVSIATYCHGNS